MNRRSRGGEAGQTLMIAALAMIPLLIMVGLVVDGGFALANQRRNQNAADAAANAGACSSWRTCRSVLSGQPLPRTDADVENAVVTTATTNGVDAATVVAYYTDIDRRSARSRGRRRKPRCRSRRRPLHSASRPKVR